MTTTPTTQPAANIDIDLSAALPNLSAPRTIPQLQDQVQIYRDDLGIPYIQAQNEPDAFLAQGFAAAQDRLWQMEYDRLRAAGRWAEAVGDTALPQDRLIRRFQLPQSAQADYAAADPHTKMMFDSYAAGINAYINGPDPLPAEYQIAHIQPEPWQPWHSLLVYKIRHILMGVFESKLWRARMVRAIGPEKTGQLFPGYQPGHQLILPPGAQHPGPLDTGIEQLAQGAAALNPLAETDLGSNSWVLAGHATATGKPILAGDSHRALDTPNAYYQNRLACPQFDVIGLSFPGVPAFPHFGHNPHVCWSVTHTAADYQDLYIERLRGPAHAPQYLYQGEWRNAQTQQETLRSNTGQTQTFPTITTHHGPIITNPPDNPPAAANPASTNPAIANTTANPNTPANPNPANPNTPDNANPANPNIPDNPNPDSADTLPGANPAPDTNDEWHALALKYTATTPPQPDPQTGQTWPAILWRMLRAQNAHQLAETQRGWVDPCNNFLFADTQGNIGYLCRGRIPIRPQLNGWLPVPGWTGQHEWQADIPFDQLPRAINPPEGYIATANNRPVANDYPHYIAIDFTPEYRVKSVTRALQSLTKPSAPDMSQIHAQRTSIPAQAYLTILPQIKPQTPAAAQALTRLLQWNGAMDAHRPEPAIYSLMRDALYQELLQHHLPPHLAQAAWQPADRGLGTFNNRFKAQITETLTQNDPTLLPPNQTWPQILTQALTQALTQLPHLFPPTPDHVNNPNDNPDHARQPNNPDNSHHPLTPAPDHLRQPDDPTPDHADTTTDLDNWTSGRIHRAIPRHTLSPHNPQLAPQLDPPPIPASGDGDTPLAGGYSPANPAAITSLSVARYAYDTADWNNSLWIIPLGSSGHPASPHYHDQSEPWRQIQMRPMPWNWPQITTTAQTHQTLTPQ